MRGYRRLATVVALICIVVVEVIITHDLVLWWRSYPSEELAKISEVPNAKHIVVVHGPPYDERAALPLFYVVNFPVKYVSFNETAQQPILLRPHDCSHRFGIWGQRPIDISGQGDGQNVGL